LGHDPPTGSRFFGTRRIQRFAAHRSSCTGRMRNVRMRDIWLPALLFSIWYDKKTRKVESSGGLHVWVANALDLETLPTWLRLGQLAHYVGAYDDNFWPATGVPSADSWARRPAVRHGFWDWVVRPRMGASTSWRRQLLQVSGMTDSSVKVKLGNCLVLEWLWNFRVPGISIWGDQISKLASSLMRGSSWIQSM